MEGTDEDVYRNVISPGIGLEVKLEIILDACSKASNKMNSSQPRVKANTIDSRILKTYKHL